MGAFTSTCLFVQEFVTGGAVTLVTDPSVSAKVGAAAVVVLAFIYTCRMRRGKAEGIKGEIAFLNRTTEPG